MRAVQLCAAALVRRRGLGIIAVALLVGLGGGAVLAAAAGARRTSTAATRLYRRGDVADLEMDPATSGLSTESIAVRGLRRIPNVRRATAVQFFALGPVGAKSVGQLNAYLGANTDGSWLYRFDRIGLLPSFRGRMPDPSRVDEVLATTQEARLLHVGIGDSLHLAVAKFDDPNASTPSSFVPVTVHVVGTATTPVGLLRGGNNTETLLFGTPAFARRFADRSVGSTVYIQLRHPGDLLAFEREVSRAVPGFTFEIKPASQELATFDRIASPYTNTLWIFALVAGVSTMLIVAQTLVRMVRSDAAHETQLRALGLTSRQRAAVAAVRAASAVLVGTLLAGAVAVLASPLFPLGLVHRVEPDPGFRIDGLVLGLGALAILVCIGGVVLATALRATRPISSGRIDEPRPSSRIVSAFARANAPVSVVGGSRLAFQRGRSNARTSTIVSIVGLVAAVAATAAALVFGANLDQLTTPRRYGQTWDAEIVSSGTSTISPTAVQRTLGRSLARGITLGTLGDVKIDHQVVPAYGLAAQRGHVEPVATRGRLPLARDEIALGAGTLRQLHRTIGDTVSAVSSDGKTERLRIVGETLLPSLNSNAPSLGADDGAELTRSGLDRLNPDLRNETDFLLIDLAPHATFHQLRQSFKPDAFTVTGAVPPPYIASYGDVQSTPLVLAGLLAALGIGVLAHLLVTSVRLSRRDLAIYKALGCTRRQVLMMVMWQALMLVSIALVLGLVIGVAIGRGTWTRFATGLGLAATVAIPTLRILAIVTVGLTSAALIAWLPARAATRTAPARVLETE